jgi:hypothetical protein
MNYSENACDVCLKLVCSEKTIAPYIKAEM